LRTSHDHRSVNETLVRIARLGPITCVHGHPATKIIEGLLSPQKKRLALDAALAMPFVARTPTDTDESSDPLVAGELSL
jgi:hypothetical protein